MLKQVMQVWMLVVRFFQHDIASIGPTRF
jgi:hypothetical protein